MVGIDGFAPVSTMISNSQVIDPHNLRLQLAVNGQVRQDGSTSEMIFKIPELLTAIAKYVTIERGDIILSTAQ